MRRILLLNAVLLVLCSYCYAMASNRSESEEKRTRHIDLNETVNSEGTYPASALNTGVIPGSPQKANETGNVDATRAGTGAEMVTKPTGA